MTKPWRVGALSFALACLTIVACNDPLNPKGSSSGGSGGSGSGGGKHDSNEPDSGTADSGDNVPLQDCNQCAFQACAGADAFCRANLDCLRIIDCGNTSCAMFDFNCLESCASSYPDGSVAYHNWANCRLSAACTTCSSSCNLAPQLCR